jgi:hypothetical protein
VIAGTNAAPPRGMVGCDRDRTGSIKGAAAPPADGGQTVHDLASGHSERLSCRRCLRWRERADTSVT